MNWKFFTILLFMANYTLGQTIPGYMGKRFTIGYSADGMFAVSPTARTSEAGGLNYTHNFDIEYGIANRTNVCVGYRYFKTGLYDLGDLSAAGGQAVYSPSSKLTMPLKSNEITLAFKFFHDGYFAPIGKYRKVGGQLMFNKAVYNKNDFLNSYRQRVSVGSGEYSFVDFCLFYELGKQRILGDRIIVNWGVRFGAVATPLFKGVAELLFDEAFSSNYYSLADEIQNDVNNRTFTHEMFNLHMGIGFLAF